jgi:threonine dehydrogenase-like Zn-dependent dehydrogenase
MSRLKSLLMYAGLLGSLFGFSMSGSFAQTAPEGTSASLLRGPEQRVALDLLASRQVRVDGLYSHHVPLERFQEGVALFASRQARKVYFEIANQVR